MARGIGPGEAVRAGVDAAMPLAEAADEIAGRPHPRYPVVRGSADDVIGFVHVRDLYAATRGKQGTPGTVGDLARTVAALPGSKPVLAALTGVRRSGGRLALVIDEYGGTDGVVTVEDLVGEIRDEYDPSARPVETSEEGTVDVDGLLHRSDVAEKIGITLPEGSYDTFAGFVLDRSGRTPAEGESVEAPGHRFTVTSMDGLRIARLRITRLPGASGGTSQS